MDFIKLGDEDFFSKYNKIKEKISSIFLDPKFLSTDTKNPVNSIIQKLKSEELTSPEEFYSFTREYLIRVFREAAILQYLGMEKTKNFAPMGEQRVSISLCRNLLKIPNDREVTQFDADRFRRLVDQLDEKLGKKSGEAYVVDFKTKSIDFYGISIKLTEITLINKYFEKIGFDYFVTATFSSAKLNFIFCKRDKMKIGNFEIDVLEEEIVRSPMAVLSIAAQNFANGIIIRKESCEVIFFNKWQKFYDQSKAERKKALNHKNSAIREGVKEKALELYKVKNSEDVKKIKGVFIDEMIDGIVWHELGHKTGEAKIDPILKAMADYYSETDTLVCTLKEAVADWALPESKHKGAIARFIEIAKTDVNKATRDIYVYLSDNWFIDEEEEFMAAQSELLTALVLNFIRKDGTVDFVRLEKEHEKIYRFIIAIFEKVMRQIESIFKSGKFKVGIHLIDFDMLEREVVKLYKDANNNKSVEELRVFPNFWVNMYAYMRKFSPETSNKLEEYYVEARNMVSLSILKNLSGGKPEEYKNSIREYIYTKFSEIGVLQERKPVDFKKAVETACAAMKMPEKITAKVQEQFEKIIKGENYDISINYEGEKDPFLATVQEMMLKSGYGDIKAGMLLGEMYDPEEPIEKRKEYIKNELENIRDQIESEMYMDVEKLRVNKKYNSKPMVEELLDTVAFFDSKKLKEKIKEVVYEDFTNDPLFEVFIPLKRGFMDWNTSQAVWRINQDLRPDEFIMQWTMDREFLEALVEVYN